MGAFQDNRLGNAIHGERVRQGYRTATEFSSVIEAVTGVNLPKDTLQRIERGAQEPKLSQYVAIAITLGLNPDPFLFRALSPELKAAWLAAWSDEYANVPNSAKAAYVDRAAMPWEAAINQTETAVRNNPALLENTNPAQ